MEQDDTVRYTGTGHSLLVTGNEYKVASVTENGLQVYIPTGFTGISQNDVILVKIKG